VTQKNILKIYLVSSFFLFLLGWQNQLASSTRQSIKTINYSHFSSGDLIFRKGNSLLSQTLYQTDRTSSFSHVGIVELVDRQPFVIHASLGEPLANNAEVKKDSLETFLNRESTASIAIYRLKKNDKKLGKSAASVAKRYAFKKLLFDSNFDLKTTDKLYCTELVWRAYLEIGLDLVDGHFSQLKSPLAKGDYLLPSNLLHSKYLKNIYVVNFKE
jgi:Permuted papain-like amidase enzyme, YaeF/YiiX, C92 family